MQTRLDHFWQWQISNKKEAWGDYPKLVDFYFQFLAEKTKREYWDIRKPWESSLNLKRKVKL